MYMNLETGEVLTRKEMRTQFREEYDGDDPTNVISVNDLYAEVDDFECCSCGKRQARLVEYLMKSAGAGQCVYCGAWTTLRRAN